MARTQRSVAEADRRMYMEKQQHHQSKAFSAIAGIPTSGGSQGNLVR